MPAPSTMATDAARDALRRDDFLDAPSTSVHLKNDVVDALLEARGWTISRRERTARGRFGGVAERWVETSFTSPTGERIWERDDALRLALVAEAFDVDPELAA